MKKTSKTIVFFGSGPVAAESLRLLSQDFDIEAVITKPKPEHHRGDFPVIKEAEKLGLKTITASNKDELSQLFTDRPVDSTIAVLIDFGIIVDQDVIDYFPLGIVNSHFSLLPKLRGADPITFSILSDDGEAGVSLMLLVKKMDEGPLLAQAPYELSNNITSPELTKDLIQLSHESLKEILPLYIEGQLTPEPQDQFSLAKSAPTYSRKLTKQDSIIDWDKPAIQIEREIRAFLEWPKSHATIMGKDVVITKAHVDTENTFDTTASENGKIFKEKDGIGVKTSDGVLIIDFLKPAGKKEMPVQAFLSGIKS